MAFLSEKRCKNLINRSISPPTKYLVEFPAICKHFIHVQESTIIGVGGINVLSQTIKGDALSMEVQLTCTQPVVFGVATTKITAVAMPMKTLGFLIIALEKGLISFGGWH